MIKPARALSLFFVLIVLAGCQPLPVAAPPPAALQDTAAPVAEESPAVVENAPASAEEAPVVLEVVGLDGASVMLTADELAALPSYQGWGGLMSSTDRITPPAQMTGAPLEALADLVGGLTPGTAMRILAEDGYAMTISYDQIVNGDFIAYDPGTGKERATDDQLQVVIVYESNGGPLDEREEGTLRMGLLNADKMQVTDGHWWVKWVRQVAVKSLAEEWTLYLEGTLNEEMDGNTAETCGSPSCHGKTWTDGAADDYAKVAVELDFQRFASVNPPFDGGVIGYGLTIPTNAPHPELAADLAAFLLGPEGQRILVENRHPTLSPPRADFSARLPAALKAICAAEDKGS